jgi:hypothetical protein
MPPAISNPPPRTVVHRQALPFASNPRAKVHPATWRQAFQRGEPGCCLK